MDKQIIIDDVDVSGCEFRFRTYGCDCMSSNRETKVLTEGSRCADNPNCYYKQLKCKEQECRFNTLKIIALQEALEQYETENDQLKRKEEIIEKLKEKHNAMCKSCPRNISCDECSNNTTLKILNGEIV